MNLFIYNSFTICYSTDSEDLYVCMVKFGRYFSLWFCHNKLCYEQLFCPFNTLDGVYINKH